MLSINGFLSQSVFQVGTMNMFVVFTRKDGGKSSFPIRNCYLLMLFYLLATELVTPPLDGMILPGVTRDSVLSLARDHVSGVKRLPNLPDNLVVSERPVTMKEVKEASRSGSLVELFGSGMLMYNRSTDCHNLNWFLFSRHSSCYQSCGPNRLPG